MCNEQKPGEEGVEATGAAAGGAEEVVETPLPNLLELAFYFEQTGVGLGREELIRVWLGMKQLVERYPLQLVRFWGKVVGLEQNYYVVEAEFREGEEPEEQVPEEEAPAADDMMHDPLSAGGADGELPEGEAPEDIPPKPVYKPPPVVPREDKGLGCNRKVLFVANDRILSYFHLLLSVFMT